MSEHFSIERMHDALDGLLEASDVAALTAHVAQCDACRETYARLSETVAELRSLPRKARAPTGLWASIAERIDGTVPAEPEVPAKVLMFPGGEQPETPEPEVERPVLRMPQLAAAAVAVSLLSAGLTWAVMRAPAQADVLRGGAEFIEGPAARAVSSGAGQHDAAISELEAIMEEGRGVLGQETLATIETSLRAVDEAMAEVERALRDDPSSPILARMLVNHQQTKLRVLRQAATAVRASS